MSPLTTMQARRETVDLVADVKRLLNLTTDQKWSVPEVIEEGIRRGFAPEIKQLETMRRKNGKK